MEQEVIMPLMISALTFFLVILIGLVIAYIIECVRVHLTIKKLGDRSLKRKKSR